MIAALVPVERIPTYIGGMASGDVVGNQRTTCCPRSLDSPMPIKVVGYDNAVKREGIKVCTLFDFTKVAELHLGPDGQNWEVLTEEEVSTLTADPKLRVMHNALSDIHHVCTAFGSRGFMIPGHGDDSPWPMVPQAVSFLHTKRPPKLMALVGGEESLMVGKSFSFTGFELQSAYNSAKKTRKVFVWRRSNKDQSIEIAINFCIQKLEAVKSL